jgi:AbrB family looped-hinge helix DNA binding protein
MDYFGMFWIYLGVVMLSFCGQDSGTMDSNGRVKFSPKVVADFKDACGGEVVLHALPEGALAVYPEDVYARMRLDDSKPGGNFGSSLVFRRNLRRFGALTSAERISAQGRVTIPAAFRERLGLTPNSEFVVVGVEIGVEIWNADRWRRELERIDEHVAEKGEREMAADLIYDGNGEE